MKRVVDLALCLCFLPLVAPILAVVALLVRTFNGAPVLFRQVRCGRNGEPFVMYKFRTMRVASETTADAADELRVTALGSFLRKTSLDELPEFINVFRGDMSLVGPRPLLMEYLPLYDLQQARRHEMRPGITGWAQINGRNAIGWPEKLQLDVWYVDHASFALDMRILLRTAWIVFRRDGVSSPGYVTAPPFRGNEADRLTNEAASPQN